MVPGVVPRPGAGSRDRDRGCGERSWIRGATDPPSVPARRSVWALGDVGVRLVRRDLACDDRRSECRSGPRGSPAGPGAQAR